MRLIALYLGKTVYCLMKLFGRHGAALPGLIAEKLDANFLNSSLNQLAQGVVVITGTNGKTTSTKMLSAILKTNMRVLTNPTGSNFTRGIASAIVRHSDWLGRLKYDIGVFELDEAYAAKFAEVFNPCMTIVLNVMRDQMDRFGEIDHTSNLIAKVVAKTTNIIVLNHDDSRVRKMHKLSDAKTFWFGVDDGLSDIYRNDDDLHGNAKARCSDKKLDCMLKKIDQDGQLQFILGGQTLDIHLESATTYNAQNAAAVILAASRLGIAADNIAAGLARVKPAFGRGEHIKVGKKSLVLQLVKNPGGFRQALISSRTNDHYATMVAINDDYADGRDVSWLWDVDFGQIKTSKFVITSGARADDMALRLKYDGIKTHVTEEDLEKAVTIFLDSLKGGQSGVVFTTYTAMLKLRKLIAKITEIDKI